MNVAQLSLDLPHRAALGAEDFLVSDCNLAAVRLIDACVNQASENVGALKLKLTHSNK